MFFFSSSETHLGNWISETNTHGCKKEGTDNTLASYRASSSGYNRYINHKHSVAFMIQDSRNKERKGRKQESVGLNVFVKKKQSSTKVSPCVHKTER